MRKIFKLKGEIIIIIIISIVISFVSTIVMRNIGYMFTKNKEINYKEEFDTSKIEYFVDEYKKGNITKEEFKDIINKWNMKYMNIYMVDANGNVLASREKGVNLIELDDVKNSEVTELEGKNIVQISGEIEINNEESIIYYYTCYSNDSKYVTFIAIFSILTLIALLSGRISYIEEINRAITKIAQGEFDKRVRIKYNNELRTLAESINIMAYKLQEEDDKKKEFITNISHDLRSPLTTMLGYINMIENNKYDNNEELKQYINIINRKGIYLNSLLDDFFTYSKLNSNDIKISNCNIDCRLFLDQILTDEKVNFANKNLELNFYCKDTKYIINADGELVRRAFYNLLTNAFKYSKENTEVKVTIDKETYKKEKFICISVINTPDKPIYKEDINKLFERLYKREVERKSKGSGLGLTITKKIMELHNGYVEVELLGEKLKLKLLFLEHE